MTSTIGNLFETTAQVISSNGIAILTIAITIIGIVGTPYYMRNRINSAENERYNQAKNNLLDILEEQLVNEKDMNEKRLRNLVSAIERRHSVSISERISKIEILQDLQLRVEESKLDIDDKEKYSERIEEKITKLEEKQDLESLPQEYKSVIDKLETEENISEEEIIKEMKKYRRKDQTKLNGGLFGATVHSYRVLFGIEDYDIPPERRFRLQFIFLTVSIIYVLVIYFILFDGSIP